MRPKFNRALVVAPHVAALISLLMLCVPGASRADTVPLIVPEFTFSTLPRITGDTLNQRLMDLHSLIRIQLPDPNDRIEPNTPLTVFRQGLRLTTTGGRVVGVLAVPVAQGHTLSKNAEIAQIANPGQQGVA